MLHRRWRLTLTGRQYVPHALQVRTKAILFDSKIHVHQMPGLYAQLAGRAVPHHRVRPGVHNRAARPIPRRRQPICLQPLMQIIGQLQFCHARRNAFAKIMQQELGGGYSLAD